MEPSVSSTSNSSIATPTKKDKDLIKRILQDYKQVERLEEPLVDSIATLKNDFLKDPAIQMALPLLCHKIRYDFYSNKITEFASDGSSVPRSLRVKFQLNCSEKEVVRTTEFRDLQDKAAETTKKMADRHASFNLGH